MASLRLAIDVRKLLANAKAVQRGLSGIQSTATKTFHGVKRSADIALGPLKTMIKLTATMKAGMIALGVASVGAAGKYEMFNQQLFAVLRNKKLADEAFRESIEFSVRTPFTPEEIVRTRLELEAVGVRGGQAVERVALAAAAMNRDIGDVGRAVKSMDTEPLRNLGIYLDDLYKKGLPENFRKTAAGFRQAQSMLLEMFEEKFAGGLGRMAITWQGLISTLKGAVFDLRAAFGEGFLDESKLIVGDLIEASKSLKDYARGAGQEFGQEILRARNYLLAGFQTAMKVAEQIKVVMSQGGIGEVILQAFTLGAKVIGRGIITAFEVSLPLWQSIGTIIGQGVLSALYASNFPGAEFARGMAMRKNLVGMSQTELRKLAAREGYDVGFTRGVPGGLATQPTTRPKTAEELAKDISAEMQKRLSIEEQITFANVDPGQRIADSIAESQQKISAAFKNLGTTVLADFQTAVDAIALKAGLEPINLTETFQTALQGLEDQAEGIMEERRRKLEMEGEATTQTIIDNAEEAAAASTMTTLDVAQAYVRMYDEIDSRTEASWDARERLLLEEYKKYDEHIKDKDLLNQWLADRQRQLDLQRAQEGADLIEGFTTMWEEMERDRLTLGEAGGEGANTISGEWTKAFQSMATEGASWEDAMNGFFRNVGDSFSNLMARMAAEAMYYEAVSPFIKAIASGFSNWLSGGGGGGGSAGPQTYDDPYASYEYHAGGTAGSGGPTRMVDPSVFAFAPRLHKGLRPNEFPAILEQGERVMAKGDTGDNVEVHMHYEGLPMVKSGQQMTRDGDKRVVDIWLKAAENDPRVKRRLG